MPTTQKPPIDHKFVNSLNIHNKKPLIDREFVDSLNIQDLSICAWGIYTWLLTGGLGVSQERNFEEFMDFLGFFQHEVRGTLEELAKLELVEIEEGCFPRYKLSVHFPKPKPK